MYRNSRTTSRIRMLVRVINTIRRTVRTETTQNRAREQKLLYCRRSQKEKSLRWKWLRPSLFLK